MKRNILLNLCLVLLLLALPALALAQDPTAEPSMMEYEEYISQDGVFRTMIPVGWVVQEEIGSPGLMLANSQETMDFFDSADDPMAETGQFGVALLLFPTEFLFVLGVEDAENSSLEEISHTLAGVFMGEAEGESMDSEADMSATAEADMAATAEAMDADAITISDSPVLVTLDEREVGTTTFVGANVEGLVGYFVPGEGISGIVLAINAPGEMANYTEVLNTVLGEFELLMTPEEIFALMGILPEDDGSMDDGAGMDATAEPDMGDDMDATAEPGAGDDADAGEDSDGEEDSDG